MSNPRDLSSNLSPDRRTGDFLVIGGGIIGLSIALELLWRGATVTILSRNFPQAAAHAAAGMLAPQAEQLPPGAMQKFSSFSRSLYADWTAKIEQISGLSTGYWECGILAPVYQAPPEAARGQDWLDAQEIQQKQSGLNPSVAGGWWYPGDGQVDNRLLVQALRSAVLTLGGEILEGEEVKCLKFQGEKLGGMHTSNYFLESDRYVLATGAWSQELLPVPIYPKKGQMLAVQVASELSPKLSSTLSPNAPELPLKQVLYGEETYIVPRQDGRIIIGATSENVGFRGDNTPQGVLQLLQAAIKLYPDLQNFTLLEQWWGFRPATADELPILGASPYSNLALAVGHYRNGILLAPATGCLMADFLLTQKTPDYFPAFDWRRFAETT
ncbi:MAG: glycine oxidase ThiO [Coleofasciculaceae cyanobacterium SM2_1_6]|nr:glycine oxidase ThiO [Coleofasciculaceae cyanobacterium SM2_1_6]